MLDVFRIGVSIGMTNNVSQVLHVIQRDLFGLKKTVDLTTGGFNSMKLAALGAMGVVATGAVLFGMGKLVEAGAEVVHQQQLMYAAGMSNKEVALATAQAWQTTSKVMGSGVTDNLKSIRELRMVFGSTADAIKYLPIMTQAQQVVGSLLGRDSQDQVFDFARALEIKGVSMDPTHFQALLDQMMKAAIASGGKVTGSNFLSAFKFGRAATQGWSDQFVAQILPTLIQEMSSGGGGGSGGPGNALMSAYAAVVGGTMSNKAAEQFWRLGLIHPGSIVHTSTGSIKGIRPGGIAGSSEFAADPYRWVQDYLMPAFAKSHVTDPVMMREIIAHMFQNRTAQQIVDMFATQQQRFQKDAGLQQKAQGLNAWGGIIKNDPTANWNAFTASLKNFFAAIGTPLVPVAITMLHALAVRIDEMTLWASKHQNLARIIGETTAGIAAVVMGLSALAVVVAAGSAIALAFTPAGWFILGISALAAGITGLVGTFRELPGAIKEVEAGFKGLLNFLGISGGSHSPTSPSPGGHRIMHGPRFGQLGMADIPADNAALADWVRAGAPVTVRNTGDISRGANAYSSRQMQKPNTGASGNNLRAMPSGSAALAMPGYG